jgi:hypothetical protein
MSRQTPHTSLQLSDVAQARVGLRPSLLRFPKTFADRKSSLTMANKPTVKNSESHFHKGVASLGKMGLNSLCLRGVADTIPTLAFSVHNFFVWLPECDAASVTNFI